MRIIVVVPAKKAVYVGAINTWISILARYFAKSMVHAYRVWSYLLMETASTFNKVVWSILSRVVQNEPRLSGPSVSARSMRVF